LPKPTAVVTRNFQESWKQFTFPEPSLIHEKPLTFAFLNCNKSIETQEDWNNPTIDKLWLYNLHYHSFLLGDLDNSLKQKIIDQWIAQNPWPSGVGWEPYPLSLRIVNWIKYFFIEKQEKGEAFKNSLFLQCFSLEKQIEYHILGNHLFENAKALFFAGIFFEMKESKRWLKKGLSILYEQLHEQVLEDGGHFERSPMYHAIILEGILDIYQLILMAKKYPDKRINSLLEKVERQIQNIVPKMLLWLSSLSHQDGKIAFFNDSTFDIASNTQSIYKYADFLGFQASAHKNPYLHLKESGYARVENQDTLLLADIGSVGPSYIPGHAHAETLSFEVSLKGERLFVNSGISTYNVSEERAYQRGTLAHNTIAINGENSSQVWSSFRVAKRAKIVDTQFKAQDSVINFSAAHDGYKCLPYGLIHRREWSLLEKKLVIRDVLTGKGTPHITVSFHLHPDWKIILQEKNRITFKSLKTDNIVNFISSKELKIKIEDYDYAVGFNKRKKACCLRLYIDNKALPFSFQSEIGW
jgi:uncharacterized heparinase superfamily protein